MFFNDLWKKFTSSPYPQPAGEGTSLTSEAVLENPALAKTVLKQQIEAEALGKKTVFENLRALKTLVLEPLLDPGVNPTIDAALELRFAKLNQHLGEAESHETLRQERWRHGVHCPNCRSTDLKRLASLSNTSSHNHRYLCLICGTEFNDDTGTPLETGLPLHVWMQCWYLIGFTDSLSYIASKLNLDLATVEIMIQQLRLTFNAQRPLSHTLEEIDWDTNAKILRTQLKEDLLRHYELLDANVATTPKETLEFRRQQNLRRTLTPSTHPPSPGGPKGRTRK